MIWAGIVGNKLVGKWKVPNGVKMTSAACVAFWKENL